MLIKEISPKFFLQDQLDFPKNYSLDMSKLAMTGHSFGGTAAIMAAARNPEIKACLTMDPSFFCH